MYYTYACGTCGYVPNAEGDVAQEKKSNSTKENIEKNKSTKFCKHCGKLIPKEAVVCTNCGGQVEIFTTQQTYNVTQQYQMPPMANNTTHTSKQKDKWITLLLCFLGGAWGLHKFYEGKIGMGVLYLFTFGLFGIGWLIDVITILGKPRYY